MARALQVEVIKKCHEGVYKALTEGTQEAIQAAIDSFLGGLDGQLISRFVSWVVYVVLDYAIDLNRKALVVALRCEYLLRSKDPWKAWNLVNKCSMCKCIGHNKQNHSGAIDALLDELKLNDKLDKIEALTDIVTSDGQSKVEEDRDEDSWFSSFFS